MENQSDAAKTASEKLKVQYIPYLVILDPEGNVVSKDGVSEIRAKGNDAIKVGSSKKLKGQEGLESNGNASILHNLFGLRNGEFAKMKNTGY